MDLVGGFLVRLAHGPCLVDNSAIASQHHAESSYRWARAATAERKINRPGGRD